MANRIRIRVCIAAAFVALGACSRETVEFAPPPPSEGPSFTGTADAATEDHEAGLTAYCATAKCPPGYTTCPDSRFPCDVDLRSDRDNCGACGSACPVGRDDASFMCAEGRCVMQCDSSSLRLDCDGVVDNGCEVQGGSDDNCSKCGEKCTDPAKPCVRRGPADVGCGCQAGFLYCTTPAKGCINPKTNDMNCGVCGTVCDPTGDGGVPPPHAYFGCDKGECGALKCLSGFADCDGKRDNGCETPIVDKQNCGACGNSCDPGQECRMSFFGIYQCMCPAGQTYCNQGCIGPACFGKCVDVSTDADNCGACGVQCAGTYAPNSVPVCTYGTCSRRCLAGRADCNGSPGDDCEVNTDSDPKNCGGCGKVCDAVPGQACVAGRCVVEACGQDAGVGPGAR